MDEIKTESTEQTFQRVIFTGLIQKQLLDQAEYLKKTVDHLDRTIAIVNDIESELFLHRLVLIIALISFICGVIWLR